MIQRSKGVLRSFILFVFGVLLVRIFVLQIFQSDYKLQADNNVVKTKIIAPGRGFIADRNGKIIVYNEAVYDLYIQLNQFKNIDTTAFCQLINISKEELKEKISNISPYEARKPYLLLRQLNARFFSTIHEQLYRFSGISYEISTTRSYSYQVGAHFLGYLSEVDSETIAESKNYYKRGDYAGKTGIEKEYEAYLRGKKGIKNIIVDVFNNPQGSYLEGKKDVNPQVGTNIITGIDVQLQQYVEELMQNKRGSVIAIEPQTGEILAYVSSPSYQPGLLTGIHRGHNFNVLSKNKNKPFFNRPILAAYPPGSTFKPIMSLIAFQEGIKQPSDPYYCEGGYQIPGHTLQCHDHEHIYSGRDAIQFSCNAYYCDLFEKMIHHPKYGSKAEGFRTWEKYLREFGYGQKLGIDIAGEKRGNIPTLEYFNDLYRGENNWRATTIISLSIGQGELLATTLQMANTMSIIANKGYYITPHIVKAIQRNDSSYYFKYDKKTVDIDTTHFSEVIRGLEKVVTSGTASNVYDERISMCGKTGTAENPHGDDHSIFTGFAPIDNPKIAFAVFVENAGYGSRYAAPIASLMSEMYLFDSIAPNREYLEKRILKANLIE